ncbi:MAG: Kelch repeat-containing protein, partial [Candidatus Limnocylindria bacterium]
MTIARDAPHAILLADGRVLVVGNDQGAEIGDPSTGTWTAIAGLDKPRTNFAMVLLQDGRAMVVGGMNDIDQSYLSAFLFDPATPEEGWVMAEGLLHTARTDPAVVVLRDGRVLVAGGYCRGAPDAQAPAAGALLASYREPDTGSGIVTDVSPPHVGAAMATAELFDPDTGQWTETGPMSYARYGAAATLLSDGRVLVVGSQCPNYGGEVTVDQGACASAEIYDPATGRFTLTGTLPELDVTGYDYPHSQDSMPDPPPHFMGTLVPLPDGGALLVGKYGSWAKGSGTVIRSYRFHVADGSWRQTGDVYATFGGGMGPTPPEPFETDGVLPRVRPLVAQLEDGRVVMAGGDGMGWSPLTTVTGRLYDPDDDSWTDLPQMPEARAAGAAVTLVDGSILVVGGHRTQASASGDETVTPLATVDRLVVS